MQLTFNQAAVNLTSTSPHVECEIGLSEISRHKPQTRGFFMRKISVYHYVGLSKALFGGAGSENPVDQPCSVRHHDWSHVVEFIKSKLGGIMPKSHNQNLTTNVSKKSTSRFNVLTRSGRSIARKVPFSTAIRLKNAQPELFIKFDSMVGVA